jgi:TonB family protein
MLQQSAMEAVRQWGYRPYLLDGKPVQVETTINVIYTLGDTHPAEAAPEVGSASPAADIPSAKNPAPPWDTPPAPIYSPEPVYPPEAHAAHQEGVVLVKTKIDAKGHPAVLEVSGPKVFQKSAREAIKKYTFHPATKNGQSIEATVTIEVNFRLYGKKSKFDETAVPSLGSASVPTPGPKS